MRLSRSTTFPWALSRSCARGGLRFPRGFTTSRSWRRGTSRSTAGSTPPWLLSFSTSRWSRSPIDASRLTRRAVRLGCAATSRRAFARVLRSTEKSHVKSCNLECPQASRVACHPPQEEAHQACGPCSLRTPGRARPQGDPRAGQSGRLKRPTSPDSSSRRKTRGLRTSAPSMKARSSPFVEIFCRAFRGGARAARVLATGPPNHALSAWISV